MGLLGEKFPGGKRAPGKVLFLGRGSMRREKGTIGSIQAAGQRSLPRPSVHSSPQGGPRGPPAAGGPCRLESRGRSPLS